MCNSLELSSKHIKGVYPPAARARGRNGDRKFSLSKSQIRLAQAAMKSRDIKVSELCKEIGVTRSTLYRYICPNSNLRPHANKLLNI